MLPHKTLEPTVAVGVACLGEGLALIPRGGVISAASVSAGDVPISTGAATPAPADVAITRLASERRKSASLWSARRTPR